MWLDASAYDMVTKLVETALDLHKRLPKAKTPHERESVERTTAATDKPDRLREIPDR